MDARRYVIIACALLGAAAGAKADTFDVTGTAIALAGQSCGSDCPLSGTIDINVSSGAVTAIDVSFPGLSAFDTFTSSSAFGPSNWAVAADNSAADTWSIDFTTGKAPSSLVGFTGGTVVGLDAFGPSGAPLYSIASGTISATATPIPGSLVLFGTALLGLLGFVFAPRRLGQDPPLAAWNERLPGFVQKMHCELIDRGTL